LYCVFVDYRKAFDSVRRVYLWQKLLKFTIDGKMFKIIKSMYNNVKSCVRQGNSCSNFFQFNVGVPQRENLSPVLFAIFLNDLVEFMSHAYNGLVDMSTAARLLDTDEVAVYFRLYLLLCADETVILAESAAELQASLNAMYLYCQTWKLQVYISKTKVVIFSRSRLNTNDMNFKYNGESLNSATNFQYLGIIFSCKGSFNDAKAHLVQQARKAMFIVFRKARKLNLPIDMQLELFDTMVVPILLYGAEVWGFENCNIIGNFHMQFCRTILKVKKSTPHCVIYGELGRIPLNILIKARRVGFWQRIMCGKREKIHILCILYCVSFKRGFYHSKWLLEIKITL
jgi:hypothetical protein